MDEFYKITDFLIDNGIRYVLKEIDISYDDNNYHELISEKEMDKNNLSDEDYVEKYCNQYANLNGFESFHDFESHINILIRTFRDIFPHAKISSRNKEDLILKLSLATRTLNNLIIMGEQYTATEPNDSFDEDGTSTDEEEMFTEEYATTKHHWLSDLRPYIELKLSVIAEVVDELQGRTIDGKNVSSKVEYSTNQIVILAHYLMENRFVSPSLSQTDIAEHLSKLTGISQKSIRPGLSDYKAFLAGNNFDFKDTDHAKIKRGLESIIKSISGHIKNT